MKKKGLMTITIYSLFCISLILVDQLTKIMAINKLMNKDNFILISKVLSFSYVENRGAAFGIFQGGIIPFAIMTMILCPILIMALRRIYTTINMTENKKTIKKYMFLQILLLFLIAGAIGNFIDRVFRGYVVDFICFDFIDFPLFNVADCYITVTTFILISTILLCFKESEIDNIFHHKNIL